MTSPVGNNLPVYDHLQLGMNPNLLALLDQLCLENGEQAVETVKFAAMAFKINPMKRRQSRVLLITDKALYNLKKDSYASFRRRIPIEHLRGMVIARNSNEIVFQIQDGYDYHYIVDNRLGVVEVTGTYYERLTNRKFEVCISEDSSLTSYVLTKTEWKNSAPELIKRRSSTHPEKVFHPKSTTANWIKHNLKTLFHSKTSEVDSVTKSGWLTYENDSTWQQYFTLLKPRSLLFLKAKHKGAFDASDVELGNEIESDTSALTLSDSSGHTFSLKGREEPPKFCFSVFNDKLKKVIRLGSSDKDELANWKDALQDLGNMPDNGSKDGWLFKQDHGEKIWRRYYFVLQSQTCAYFDMDVEQEIGLRSFHAEAVLDVACATIAVNGSGIGALSQNGFPFRFTIRDGCKSYHLASDSEKTREDWIWAINAAIEEENGSIEVSIAPKSIPDQSFENSQVTQITLVVSDVQGSTMLWEREPGAMNVALEMHDHILRSALGRCNGYEVKTEGDAFVVAFIEALDAIRWCVSAQYDLLKAEWPSSLANCYDAHNEYGVGIGSAEAVVTTSKLFAGLRVRMGIHTGTPRKRRNSITNRIDYSGTDVHLTSRISSAAHGGQIICSDAVVKAVNTKMKEDDDFSVVRLPGSYKLQRVRNPSTVVLYEIWPKGLQGRKLLLPPLRACRVSVNLQRSHTGSTEEPKRNKDDLEKSEKALAQLTWDEKCRVSNSWSHPQIKPRPPKVIMANTT